MIQEHDKNRFPSVILAEAGIQQVFGIYKSWIPVFTGTTKNKPL